MSFWYAFIDTILPFGWLEPNFMKNALLAVLIMTPLFGILGTMIVNNRMAFFSDALGHSALTGIAVGILLGIADTNVSMIIFAFIFALVLREILTSILKIGKEVLLVNQYMSQKENNDFREACEAEILCDAKYCPYMNGTVSRLGACEGDFCKEAWEEYCEQSDKEYE